MRKKLVSAIDGLRNNLQHMRNDTNESTDECEFELSMEEKILPQNCSLNLVVRHGFPEEPRCMAYDAVQRLLAIGAARGAVRLIGQAGVDVHLKHETSNEPVVHIQFLINEGGLITVLRDDTIHLWNYRQTTPKVVNSLKMVREHISCVYLPFQSKWLYVGTDKGNVYFLALANFELSSYVINWNRAIDVSCRTHPGAVRQFSICPSDPARLLIVFEAGHVVMWNFQTRDSERFAVDQSAVRCVSWHNDGRQFMCGHRDGSLTIWNIKKPRELVHRSVPHSPNDSSINCRPITHLHWSANSDGDQMIFFAGGMPEDEGVLPALTIIRGKGSVNVLELDHPIVEMCPLNASPYATAPQHPFGAAVLLKSDLFNVDLLTQGYPCFESPHSMDIHESPVTFISYYAECPGDLIAALTLVGRNQRRQGVRLSDRSWPITGGIGRECATGFQEMLLTGHEDGSIKFWQASSENLQIMYRLKTGRHFERVITTMTTTAPHSANSTNTIDTAGGGSEAFDMPTSSSSSVPTAAGAPSTSNTSESCGGATSVVSTPGHSVSTTVTGGPDTSLPSTSAAFVTHSSPSTGTTAALSSYGCSSILAQVSHAVLNVELCVDSRLLLVAGASGQVTLFRFVKNESCQDIAVIALPQLCSSLAALPHTPTPSTCTAAGVVEDVESTSGGTPRRAPPPRGSSSASNTSQRAELQRQLADVATQRGDSHSTDTSCGSQSAEQLPLKVRGGPIRRPAGYQPELVCQIPWIDGHTPERVTALALNSAYGVLAVATAGGGMALIDIAASTVVYAWTNAELHGRDAIALHTSLLYSGGFPCSGITLSDEFAESMHQNQSLNPSTQSGGASPGTGAGNLTKSFVRLNTDARPRNAERQRPVLYKAQSMAVPSCTLNPPPHLHSAQEYHADANFNGETYSDDNRSASRASSAGSLEQLESVTANNHFQFSPFSTSNVNGASHGGDFVTSLTFINSCSKKKCLDMEPTLWLGMSSGACVAFNLMLPANRITSNVVVAPSDMFDGPQGSVVQLKGRMLHSAFLKRDFCIIVGASETFRDPNKDSAPSSGNAEKLLQNKVLTKTGLSPTIFNVQDQSSSSTANAVCPPEEFTQLGVFISEYEIRVIALPGYSQFFHHKPEIPFVKARTSHIHGYPVLISLNGASQIVVLSLPSLRVLLQTQLYRGSLEVDDIMCQKTDFSEHGLGVYSTSPSEIQKFTVTTELAAQIAECSGELFVPVDMPEPPKTSFLRGVSTLFGANSQRDNVDLDAIFSEKPTSSVTNVKAVAKQIPSHNFTNNTQLTNMESTSSRSITAGQAASMALQNLSERGEKLGAVIDATENLRNNAMNLQSRSSKLVEKYEKKKWYQL